MMQVIIGGQKPLQSIFKESTMTQRIFTLARNFLTRGVLLAFLAFAGTNHVHAVYTDDTVGGTTFSNTATLTNPTFGIFTNASTTTLTVKSNFGLSSLINFGTNTNDAQLTSFKVTNIYTISNAGNISFGNRVSIDLRNFTVLGSSINAAGWQFTIISNGAGNSVGSNFTLPDIGEDNFFTFGIEFTVPGNENNNVLGDVDIFITNTGTPIGTYTNVIGEVIGGTNLSVQPVEAVLILKAILALRKTFGVSAPAGYSGNPTDLVPGSIITFTNFFSNAGGAPISNVYLVDQLQTNLFYIVPDTNHTITNGNIKFTNQYSTDGGLTWAFAPAALVEPSVDAFRVVLKDSPIAPGEVGTITFKVMLR